MLHKRLAAAIGCVAMSVLVANARAEHALVPELQPLEGLIGTWEVQGEWGTQDPMWARTTYTPILEGRFIEARTFTRDGEANPSNPIHLHYHTILAPTNDPGVFDAHSFKNDGAYQIVQLRIDRSGEDASIVSGWQMGQTHVREALDLPAPDDDRMAWKVWFSSPDQPERIFMDTAWHRSATADPAVEQKPIDPSIAPLEQFRGVWEIQTTWPDARALWARATVHAHPGGKLFVSRVQAREGTREAPDTLGPMYDRYRTFYITEPGANIIREITFSHDAEIMEGELEPIPNEPNILVVTYPTQSDRQPQITKTMQFTDERTMQWSVVVRMPAGADQFTTRTLAEGTWRRIDEDSQPKEHAMTTRPIDPTLFDASGMQTGQFTVTETIDAPPEKVFAAFADGRAFEQTFAPQWPDAKANIDLAIGGRYEWLFDGSLGSNACQVLSYIPNRMISFSWNAPPNQPESREKHTWVVVEVQPAASGAGADVTLTHLGFGADPHWAETKAYFEQAWPYVLATLKQNLEAE